jgi:hypothetical protein
MSSKRNDMNAVFGIDFDNTIVCYDGLFHRVALEKGLITPEITETKDSVRNYLRVCGMEDAWTELQGYVYGARMEEAEPFPCVEDFFRTAVSKGIQVYIISHKTRYPFRGPNYDLHDAALNWLDSRGFFAKKGIGISRENVFFETTKEDKLRRIEDMDCSYFIDDLPEFLMEDAFPRKTKRVLFAPSLPANASMLSDEVVVLRSWDEISKYFRIMD